MKVCELCLCPLSYDGFYRVICSACASQVYLELGDTFNATMAREDKSGWWSFSATYFAAHIDKKLLRICPQCRTEH
jgi:hypothetical protein